MNEDELIKLLLLHKAGRGHHLDWPLIHDYIDNIEDQDNTDLSLKGEEFLRKHKNLVKRITIELGLVDTEDFFDGKRFVPKRLADYLLSVFNFKTTIDNETVFVYNSNFYKPTGEIKIKETVESVLKENSKIHHVNEVIGHVKRSSYFNRKDFNKNKKLLNLNNGVLNIETGEFLKHDPKFLMTSQIPINYDPEADCPKIMEFLGEVLYEKDINIIQEFCGFSLFTDYFIRKAVILHGEGNNGKTTFLLLLQNFMGNENVSSVSMQEFDKKSFAIAELYGKYLNVYDDMPQEVMFQTGRFKQVTGGSPIMAEKKFQNPFNFVNFAKMIFSCNELPKTKDKTPAFFERIIIITFPYTFVDNPKEEMEKKKKIRTKLLEDLCSKEEKSGLLNWALIGLKRLLENGSFSYSKGAEEVRIEYERKSDPVSAFVDSELIVDSEKEMDKKLCYSHYVSFCQENNYSTKSYNSFCRSLIETLGTKIHEEQPKIGDKRIRVWVGIRFKEEEERISDQRGLEGY